MGSPKPHLREVGRLNFAPSSAKKKAQSAKVGQTGSLPKRRFIRNHWTRQLGEVARAKKLVKNGQRILGELGDRGEGNLMTAEPLGDDLWGLRSRTWWGEPVKGWRPRNSNEFSRIGIPSETLG